MCSRIPGWYTPYTPYQAEIAQGRLESLLNFQTVVRDLTAMDIATASLLDEGTAAAEAMAMFHRLQAKKIGTGESLFLVGRGCYPQTLDVLRGRAEPLDIQIEIVDPATVSDETLSKRSVCCCSSRTTAARLPTCGRPSSARTPRACSSRSPPISWR